ncbi:ABC-three component system middle component 1 [Kordia sp.]|uniref:ABC-three component system middle component 1 n=1 Tax=Kordia sp. TaxID=1965332 RepID=UPI003D27908E
MSYSVNDTIEILKDKFRNFRFNFKEIEFGGSIPTFFIYPENDKLLEENWIKIADTIAVDFQARLLDEFSAWNIYLFYVIDIPIRKELKYKIENDTFSSRKIIVDNTIDEDSMITEHIINNITVISDEDEIKSNEIEPNTVIESLLKDKILKRVNTTKAASETYKELLTIIKKNKDEV